MKVFRIRQVDRSASFISHYFKRELGKSPAEYILAKQMNLAKKLLQEGRQVKNFADMPDFYDTFHFSKLFKKYFGKSPLAFRSSVNTSTDFKQPIPLRNGIYR